MQILAHFFFDFRYIRGERACYIQDKVLHSNQQSLTPGVGKLTFFGIIIV
jgi:hypothetical protein